jgi:hypothetical protein
MHREDNREDGFHTDRTPAQGRSLKLLLPREQLPDLM